MDNANEQLSSDVIPPYVKVVKGVFGKSVLASKIYMLLGMVIILSWLGINLTWESVFTQNIKIAVLNVIVVIFAGLALLSRAYEIIMANIHLVYSMLVNEEQKTDLNRSLVIMFSNHVNQRYFVMIFAGLVTMLMIKIDINAFGFSKAVFELLGFIAYVVLGYGLWLALTTMSMILKVSTYELKLPILSSDSEGLKALSLIGTSFALFFSIETTLCIVTLVTVDWNYKYAFEFAFTLAAFPAGICVSVTFFLVTYFSIQRIISHAKIKRSQKVEEILETLDIKKLDTVEKVEYYLKLTDLHKRILTYSVPITEVFGFSSLFRSFISIFIPTMGWIFDNSLDRIFW